MLTIYDVIVIIFSNCFTHVFQSQVPDQIMKVSNVGFTDDNHLFTPLKKFPDTFSEQERYPCHFLV